MGHSFTSSDVRAIHNLEFHFACRKNCSFIYFVSFIVSRFMQLALRRKWTTTKSAQRKNNNNAKKSTICHRREWRIIFSVNNLSKKFHRFSKFFVFAFICSNGVKEQWNYWNSANWHKTTFDRNSFDFLLYFARSLRSLANNWRQCASSFPEETVLAQFDINLNSANWRIRPQTRHASDRRSHWRNTSSPPFKNQKKW